MKALLVLFYVIVAIAVLAVAYEAQSTIVSLGGIIVVVVVGLSVRRAIRGLQ
jgi:hypothetical protein